MRLMSLKNTRQTPASPRFAAALLAALLMAGCAGDVDEARDIEVSVATSTVAPAATALTGATPALPASSCDRDEMIGHVISSTAEVMTASGTGTAFHIGGGEFITSAHVIDGDDEVRLRTSTGLEVSASSAGVVEDIDIALLQTDLDVPTLEWGMLNTLAEDDPVFAFGYPSGATAEATMTSGTFVAETTVLGMDILDINVPVAPGSSGGPLVDECGAVMGVVFAQWARFEGGAAVPVGLVVAALPEARRGMHALAGAPVLP